MVEELSKISCRQRGERLFTARGLEEKGRLFFLYFFRHGLLLSLLLLAVVAVALTLVWPVLGMPILRP